MHWKLGVVGNRSFQAEMLIDLILDTINTIRKFITVTGLAIGTDKKSVRWSLWNDSEFRGFHPNGKIITNQDFHDIVGGKSFSQVMFDKWYATFDTSQYSKKELFVRNERSACDMDNMIAFINKGQYRSGTWNTIKHFRRLKPNNWILIYDQFGERWTSSELRWKDLNLEIPPDLEILKTIRARFDQIKYQK